MGRCEIEIDNENESKCITVYRKGMLMKILLCVILAFFIAVFPPLALLALPLAIFGWAVCSVVNAFNKKFDL